MKALKIAIKTLLIIFVSVVLVYIVGVTYKYFQYKKEVKYSQEMKQKLIIQDSLDCECNKIKAREYIRRGEIIVGYQGEPYLQDITMKDYGLYAYYMPECMQVIMDSALYSRFGADFYDRIKRKSDSIYKLIPHYAIDLDGYHTAAIKEPKYKCGEIEKCYDYIEDSLFKLKLLPLKQDSCFPDELLVDAVITKKGKLTKIRVLRKVNPEIDKAVVNLLGNLPCDWVPAFDGDKNVDYRKMFYFFFNNNSLKKRKHP